MKALRGTFNQEKALVGAFSVILQPVVEPMDRFTAIIISFLVIVTAGGTAPRPGEIQLLCQVVMREMVESWAQD